MTCTLLCSVSLLCLLLFVRSHPVLAQAPAAHPKSSWQPSRSGENGIAANPAHSVAQLLPCPEQARTFKALSRAYAEGHVPSQSEMNGTWVPIGLWLYRDSRPDLNCAGIRRGAVLEWVIFARGYSLDVNALGTYRQKPAVELGPEGDLTFSIDWLGDTNPVFRCRLSRSGSLVCLGDAYYNGVELKKMPVRCEPLPTTASPHTAQSCIARLANRRSGP